jgi:hypothetical protein
MYFFAELAELEDAVLLGSIEGESFCKFKSYVQQTGI